MSDRITKQDVHNAFRWAFSDDERAAPTKGNDNAANIGKLALEHVPAGWCVIAYSAGDSGSGWAQSYPLSHGYRPTRDMVAFLDGIRECRMWEADKRSR